MLTRAVIAIGLLANAAFCCPPTTTVAGTNCPSPPTCPPNQSCATAATTTTTVAGTNVCSGTQYLCSTVACSVAGQLCQNAGQYPLCTITPTNPMPAGTAVKFCSTTPGFTCSTIPTATAAAAPNSFNDYASCCAATITGVANGVVRYETFTIGTPQYQLCLGAVDATPYKICAASAAATIGTCVRFPNACTTAATAQALVGAGVTLAPEFTGRSAGTTGYATFQACATAATFASKQTSFLATNVIVAGVPVETIQLTNT